jgi:polyhydroxyalkanoate synthesis regulator phasin
MRGTLGETLERLILLQVGAAAATRDRVERVVEDLIRQGRIEREEGRTVVNDVMNRARERSAGTRALFDASVQQGLRTAGVPNREAYEDLLFRVEQLEHRVRLLEDLPTVSREARERVDREAGVGAVPPTAPDTPAPGVPEAPLGDPAAPMPPGSSFDETSQPPGTGPDTTPGLPPRP